MRTPRFTVVKETKTCLLIQDLGPWNAYPTITNGAEEVVQLLAPRLLDRRLEYLDSEGNRDQLLVVDGQFAGFAPAGGKP